LVPGFSGALAPSAARRLVPGCSALTNTSSPVGRATPPRFPIFAVHKIFDVVLGRSEAALEDYLQIYRFKQSLCYLLLEKYRTRKQCVRLVSRFLTVIDQLRHSGLAQLVTLAETLSSWQQEIAPNVAFYRQQWHHRRIPHQDRGPAAPGPRISQFLTTVA
jgi:hypothetical protein